MYKQLAKDSWLYSWNNKLEWK